MAKYKVIDIELYKRDITVFIGTHNEFKEWVSIHTVPDSWVQLMETIVESENNALASYWHNKNDGNGIIELPFHPKTHTEIATATHEALHAVFHILDYVGVQYVPNGSNEAFTYLLEYIVANIMDFNDYQIINI